MFLSLPVPALSPPTTGNLLAWDGGKYEPSLNMTWSGTVLTIVSNATGVLNVKGDGVGTQIKLERITSSAGVGYLGADVNWACLVRDGSAVSIGGFRQDGSLSMLTTTDASAVGTASATFAGGLGIAKKLYVGDNVILSASKTITAPGGLIIGNETMDTYDEGTWTPVIFGDGTAGTNTYSVQLGKYVKIGKAVVAEFYITMTAKDGAMAGNILLGGLPFTATTSLNFGCTTNLVENITFGSYLGLNGSPSTTSMYLVKNNTGAASGICQAADLTNTSQLRGTVSYITA